MASSRDACAKSSIDGGRRQFKISWIWDQLAARALIVRKMERLIGEPHHVLLTPDRNVWRLERAERAAVLVNANYFGALRGALLKAQSTVFMLGWDLDSRTRLVGESGKADDGFPEGFADFLTALVNQRPHLTSIC